MTSAVRGNWLLAVVGVVALVHGGLTLAGAQLGHLSVDEVTYDVMTRAVATGAGFTIDNGYTLLPSEELTLKVGQAYWVGDHGGRLVGKYPVLFSFLAAPFYALFGYGGLFFLNALAFVIACALLFALGKDVGGGRAEGILSVALFALATYSWEYSQAAWPHMTVIALLVACAWLSLRGVREGRASLLILAGLLGGVATAIRLDSLLIFAPLGLMALWGRAPGARGSEAPPPRSAAPDLPLKGGGVGLPVQPVAEGDPPPAPLEGEGGCEAAGRGGVPGEGPSPQPRVGLPGGVLTGLGAALRLAAGLIPALAFLSVTNALRFGTLSPFSYGEGQALTAHHVARMAPVAAVAVLMVVAALALSKAGARQWLWERRWGGMGITSLLILGALMVPTTRELGARWLGGMYDLVVDLRSLDGQTAAATQRMEGGAVLYIGGIKKALLQSCPWLPLCLIPLIAFVRKPRAHWPAVLLVGLGGMWVAAFSFSAWHGGLGLNLRYFLPSVAFFSVVGAMGLAQLMGGMGRGGRSAVAAWGLALVALNAAIFTPEPMGSLEAFFVLELPLLWASLCLVAVATWALGDERARRWARGPAVALAVAAVMHASAVALAYDYPRSRAWRARDAQTTAQVLRKVETPALIFATRLGPFGGLYGHEGVAVAMPRTDDFADFDAITQAALTSGRRVYAYLPRGGWGLLYGKGHLAGLEVEELGEFWGLTLGEIRRAEGGSP